MPKDMKKRIYTYGQLDTILHKRGEPGKLHTLGATLYGAVRVEYSPGMSSLFIVCRGAAAVYRIAEVHSIAGGDTLYRVLGATDEIRKSTPAARAKWRKYVTMFTPRTVEGRVLRSDPARWYRIRNGTATEIAEVPRDAVSWLPRNRSLLLPKSSRPTPQQWVQGLEQYPKFVRRSLRFARDLRKALADGIKADMQLIEKHEMQINRLFHANGLFLHVCLPATEQARSKRLVVGIGMHDKESRAHFQVDGDYGIKHCQLEAYDADTKNEYRWPCRRDAIVGIKEWVMSSIYIPGL
jgi:hypothetical protein